MWNCTYLKPSKYFAHLQYNQFILSPVILPVPDDQTHLHLPGRGKSNKNAVNSVGFFRQALQKPGSVGFRLDCRYCL